MAEPALPGRPRQQNSWPHDSAPRGRWYEELCRWLDQERTIPGLEDAAIGAGLAHELSWAAVCRIAANLPEEDNPCRYCGGLLRRWSSEPGDQAWRCQACGRLQFPVSHGGRPNRAEAEEIGRQARESWCRAEARIAGRTSHPNGDVAGGELEIDPFAATHSVEVA